MELGAIVGNGVLMLAILGQLWNMGRRLTIIETDVKWLKRSQNA